MVQSVSNLPPGLASGVEVKINASLVVRIKLITPYLSDPPSDHEMIRTLLLEFLCLTGPAERRDLLTSVFPLKCLMFPREPTGASTRAVPLLALTPVRRSSPAAFQAERLVHHSELNTDTSAPRPPAALSWTPQFLLSGTM